MSFFDFFGGMPGGMPHGHGFGMDDEDEEPADTNRYYEIMDVAKDASQSEIKKAYKKKARQLHPDRHPNEREEYNAKFQELQKANEVLSDEHKRQIYDRYGERGVERMGRGGPGGSHSDILRSFFDGPSSHSREQGPRKSPSVKCVLDCTLEDLYKGSTKSIDVEIRHATSSSGGECSRCRGRGRVTITQQRGMMLLQSQQECPDCDGQGYDLASTTKTINVDIPVGAKHAEIITLPGEGNDFPDHVQGDILVHLRVADHDTFTRRGADLGMEYKLSLRQAMCGYSIRIPHVSGKILILESKPGEVTQPGALKRVFTWGMPQRYSSHVRGHLYIQMEVVLPLSGSLSPRAIEEFAKILPQDDEKELESLNARPNAGQRKSQSQNQNKKRKKDKKKNKKKKKKNQPPAESMDLDDDYVEIVTADDVVGNPQATPASSRGVYDEDEAQDGVPCQQM